MIGVLDASSCAKHWESKDQQGTVLVFKKLRGGEELKLHCRVITAVEGHSSSSVSQGLQSGRTMGLTEDQGTRFVPQACNCCLG